jgi:uncharacterized protein YukE
VSQEYANKLEVWFSSLPGIVQDALHEPFSWMDNALRSVAGDPDALLAAVPQYLQIADAVEQVGRQQLADRQALAGHWSGEAYDAFCGRMQFVEAQLDQVAQTIRQVKEVLETGARACVESANMIIDLVTSLIMFALGTLAVNVALSVITFGASLAAEVALVIARAATTLAKVARVVEKLAAVLNKIAQVFVKLEKLLRRIVEILKQIKEVLKEADALTKASKGWDKVGAMVSGGIQKAVVSKGIWAVTGGTVNIPGGVGSLVHSGSDYVEGWQQAGQAEDQARR